MEKKFLDETTLTYLRNYIDGQDKVIYKTAADLISATHLESLLRPTTQPLSQVIPTITAANEQQYLTIGEGLEVRDGALTARACSIPALPEDAATKTYTLQSVNGTLAWTNAIGDAIGEINTILDDINGDIDEVLNKGY